MRHQDEVRQLLTSLLGRSAADEAEATYEAARTLSTRFGENAITQNSVGDDETMTLNVIFGRRRGSASTNRLDDSAALDSLVARAEVAARQAPEDPELVALPGPQVYGPRPPRFFAATADLEPAVIADDVAQVVGAARAKGFRASGLFQTSQSVSAIANSRGLWGWDAATEADYSTTVHGPAGSGKAAQSQSAHERLDMAQLAQTAVDNAVRGQNPQPIEPGDHTVIFEPLAVHGILGFLAWALNAREADEGSSVFAGTLGQQLLHPLATLSLDIDDPELPAPTMGQHGQAVEATRWIEGGAVKRLYHDRYWAQQKGMAPDAARMPLFMAGGTGTVDDLIAGCKRGLLVKNLWYIRNVDWKSLTLTGMTRDGVFLVEDGRIVRPVSNLRWNESPISFLNNLVALSRPIRTGGWSNMKVPGALSENFTFTSVTASV